MISRGDGVGRRESAEVVELPGLDALQERIDLGTSERHHACTRRVAVPHADAAVVEHGYLDTLTNGAEGRLTPARRCGRAVVRHGGDAPRRPLATLRARVEVRAPG